MKELERAQWAPGVWKCKTCNFVNHRNTIHPNGIFADTKILEEPCPNDGDVMFPMTWEEMAKENQEFGIKLLDRERKKDDRIAALEAGLREASDLLQFIKANFPSRTSGTRSSIDCCLASRERLLEGKE